MCKSLCFWTGERTGPPSYHESSLSPLQKIKKSGCKSFSIWIRSNTSCHLQRKVTQNEWSTLVQCGEAVHSVKTEVLETSLQRPFNCSAGCGEKPHIHDGDKILKSPGPLFPEASRQTVNTCKHVEFPRMSTFQLSELAKDLLSGLQAT